VIFPFEERIYRDADVPVEWVGHPLLDVMPPSRSKSEIATELGLNGGKPIVALLPGSRRNEVGAILPDLVGAGEEIRRRLRDVQFVLARAPHVSIDLLQPLDRLDPSALIVEGRADDVLAVADVALVASGTITVQAALHECPMVVVYRLSPLTYRLGRRFVRVDTFAMANLVAGKRVVPELIQDDFTPGRVASEALAILTDPERREAMKRELAEVRKRLGTPGASARAARAVLQVGRQPHPSGSKRL
jgi:lipid-A-disaccharide synthase